MTITLQSVALRSAIVVSAMLIVLVAAATEDASPSAGSWTIALVALACAVGAAVQPDGPAAGVAIALLLVNWLMVVDDELSLLTPVGAVLVLVLHTAASLESVTPAGIHLAPSTYRRWAIRWAIVAAAAIGTWLAALAAANIDHTSNIVLVLGIGLLVGGGVWLMRARVLSA
ncbi:hypothetical protein [Solicola gregarius]|uniref:Uncharacterized protein n=1 Tax=Solicola gregarius TaxID=2908642 RepID=A0AA46TJH2_9ACTN|nr:hypothetical protein [Solicola gregarius]UYM06451.1 hypothetical protein L0C25_05085 [Solicola gregarius]